ncbi:MAG TPA: hypothetical protein VMW62_14310 [Chloroflexota bacterium]|nr:hypothetical protein [Chloroflexota bacterium]
MPTFTWNVFPSSALVMMTVDAAAAGAGLAGFGAVTGLAGAGEDLRDGRERDGAAADEVAEGAGAALEPLSATIDDTEGAATRLAGGEADVDDAARLGEARALVGSRVGDALTLADPPQPASSIAKPAQAAAIRMPNPRPRRLP